MNRRVRILLPWLGLSFCLGGLLGLALRGGAREPDPKVSTATQTRSAQAPVLAPPRVELDPEDGGEVPGDCDRLEAELEHLEDLASSWFGAPQAWPQGEVDPRVAPGGFTTWVNDFAATREGVDVVQVDCTSYPCVGVWSARKNMTGALLSEMDALGDLSAPMRLVPVAGASGDTDHWLIAASLSQRETADQAPLSVRINAALNASGQYGEPISPDDPESLVPIF